MAAWAINKELMEPFEVKIDNRKPMTKTQEKKLSNTFWPSLDPKLTNLLNKTSYFLRFVCEIEVNAIITASTDILLMSLDFKLAELDELHFPGVAELEQDYPLGVERLAAEVAG